MAEANYQVERNARMEYEAERAAEKVKAMTESAMNARGTSVNECVELTVPQAQVQEQQELLYLSIEELHQALNTLEMRLTPVLRPMPQSGALAQQNSSETLAPLAAMLKARHEQVADLRSIVVNLLDTLQV